MIPEFLDQSGFFLLILWSFLIGIFLGIIYDVFRIRRISFLPEVRSRTKTVSPDKQKKSTRLRRFFVKNIKRIDFVLILFEDIFFFTFVAVVMVLLMYKLNGGRVRLFALFPTAFGFILYRITVGKLVVRCAEIVIRFIRLLFDRIASVTIRPLMRVLKKAYDAICTKIYECRRIRYTDRREKLFFAPVIGQKNEDKRKEGKRTDEIG